MSFEVFVLLINFKFFFCLWSCSVAHFNQLVCRSLTSETLLSSRADETTSWWLRIIKWIHCVGIRETVLSVSSVMLTARLPWVWARFLETLLRWCCVGNDNSFGLVFRWDSLALVLISLYRLVYEEKGILLRQLFSITSLTRSCPMIE